MNAINRLIKYANREVYDLGNKWGHRDDIELHDVVRLRTQESWRSVGRNMTCNWSALIGWTMKYYQWYRKGVQDPQWDRPHIAMRIFSQKKACAVIAIPHDLHHICMTERQLVLLIRILTVMLNKIRYINRTRPEKITYREDFEPYDVEPHEWKGE